MQTGMVCEATIVTQSHIFLLPVLVESLAAPLVEVALFDGYCPATAQFPILELIVSFLGRREQV
jgi:hypothetical protein